LTDKQIIFDQDVKGVVHFSKNLKITKENSEIIFSDLLSMVGLAKIHLKDNIWKIINARDIRYTPTKLIDGYVDEIPDNSDYIQAIFQLKNKDYTGQIVRNFRPFMSRYGRILDIKRSNSIIITDSGVNIKRLKKLIKILDVPQAALSKNELKELKKEKEFRKKIDLLKAKNCTMIDHYYKHSSRSPDSKKKLKISKSH